MNSQKPRGKGGVDEFSLTDNSGTDKLEVDDSAVG